MKPRILSAAVVVLVLGTVLPAHAVVLRYHPTVGAVHRHKTTGAGAMEMSMAGMGQTMRMQMTTEMESADKVLSETEETVRVEQQLLSGSVTLDMQGQSQTQELPSFRVVSDVDRRGRMVKVVEGDFRGDEMQGAMQPTPENLPDWSQFGAFPEGDVGEGDTWTDTITIPAPPAGEMEMTFTSRLLALTTFQDRKCAKIRTEFNAPIDFRAEDMPGGEAGAPAEGTLKGDLLWYYDYENSVYVYGEGSMGMTMRVEMPEAGGEALSSNLLMNLKIALVD